MTIPKRALALEVEAGKKYLWCRCGGSQTLPLCDFSHDENGSDKKPLKFVAEKTATVYLCACTRTENPPYCDGFQCDGG